MDGTWLALVLAGSVAHAGWNAIAKTVAGHGYVFVFCYQALQAVLLLVGFAGVSLLAPGMLGPAPNWIALGAGAVTGLLHMAYSLSLQTGYERADMSVVYPTARGVGPLVTMLVAIAVLGQRPGALGIIGGVLILVGITVVTLSGSRSGGSGRIGAGIRWGALTGLAIAGYTLFDDFSVNRLGLSPVLYYGLGCACVGLLMAPRVLHSAGARAEVAFVVRRYGRQTLAVGLLSPTAYLLVLYAMQHVSVALVAPLRETSIIIGTLFAWWFFGERGLAPKLAGAGIVLAGIACIAIV
ncbi:EamA family transporter [Brevibacterium sp. 50QC2O2]|uniref:EamA family transporter n=1 Tax=Brevibacterium TaxID=1696 RepID=UPI00211C2EED|nr:MULTISPECIES: EamA family transporter [unclassified Brevibacterium]MCQ9368097.1 EamA family transporter [Brevibacterium sp. 91QC2O2]MCQ9385299.1 EamA family transporter [Brevibacterium sp. 68QC2CO]MCQ9388805.1 EamA family transporter [Brevibacterium sp. 50QC2O2]